MSAILGSTGSTIAEDLSLDAIPEFIFKDDIESCNFMTILEKRSLAWQPSSIPPQLQERILADLVCLLLKFFMVALSFYFLILKLQEKNRSLAEARSILISVITHLHSNTEPLVISKVNIL